MPRKAFLADLAAACAAGPLAFGAISNVEAGSDDGEVKFSYWAPEHEARIQICALIPELSDYPKSHDYHVFTDDEAPRSVAQALQSCPSLSGKPLGDALLTLAQYLSCATSGDAHNHEALDSDGDSHMPDSQLADAEEEDSDQDLENEDWAMENDSFHDAAPISTPTTNGPLSNMDTSPIARSARADLRAAKAAGFKVSLLGSLQPGNCSYVSLGCRICKLGISEEAMEAWSLKPCEYLVLIICYSSGYKTSKTLTLMDQFNCRQSLEMSVAIGDTYKPVSVAEAQRAMSTKTKNAKADVTSDTTNGKGLRDAFISRALNGLLNDRFQSILKIRLQAGASWTAAERIYNESQGRGVDARSSAFSSNGETEEKPATLPPIVTNDELLHRSDKDDLSLPLIAMQFLLRHFVRCTEFCLVCHCKMDTNLEVIKPYVCEKPLCLFQYMSLGFGPSIEHEIITQPLVVDLLISFCYAGAQAQTLDSHPRGLALSVPDPKIRISPLMQSKPSMPSKFLSGSFRGPIGGLPGPAVTLAEPKNNEVVPEVVAKLDRNARELLFDLSRAANCPCRPGDWLVIVAKPENHKHLPQPNWFCRVTETFLFPTVKLGVPIPLPFPEEEAGAPQPDPRCPQWENVHIRRFDLNFDDLDRYEQNQSILQLLDLLPSVSEMKDFLCGHQGKSLGDWGDRVPSACQGLLRWIIASNRSCIVQVDQLDGTGATEERVQGVSNFMQFRFAMGAPDKEQRFLNSIHETTSKLAHPTLFAWHGSPLWNWHSIIRQGLHFNKTAHGRAYGNGVYHAMDFHTSGGYSGASIEPRQVGSSSSSAGPVYAANIWPRSKLCVTSAVALSEIVNAPEKFVSKSPFYVVNQLDWIQTRYLFVHSYAKLNNNEETPLRDVFGQDKNRTPRGPTGQPIVLPITAVPKSRRRRDSGNPQTKHKFGIGNDIVNDIVNHDDSDADSVATDLQDRETLAEPDVVSGKAPKSRMSTVPSTAFSPNDTDLSNLPLITAPAYATPPATKRLQKDFLTLQRTQQSHIDNGTLADLGWFAREDHLANTGNLYQWIIELHSFPLTLPLAVDLQQRSIQSVVLEFRFHASYPISPPFVRVVRPRFLPFLSGGGGHVTAGGSICMDLLTNSGWTAVSDIESVLLQIRMAIMSTEPRPARLEGMRGGEYGAREAVDAFIRACKLHGWTVPESLTEISRMG